MRMSLAAGKCQVMPRVVIAFGEQAGESEPADAGDVGSAIRVLGRDREQHAIRQSLLPSRDILGSDRASRRAS